MESALQHGSTPRNMVPCMCLKSMMCVIDVADQEVVVEIDEAGVVQKIDVEAETVTGHEVGSLVYLMQYSYNYMATCLISFNSTLQTDSYVQVIERIKLLLKNPKTAFASRAFCNAAPVIWNSLPHLLNDYSSSPATFHRNL